jgi:hypothetical protein
MIVLKKKKIRNRSQIIRPVSKKLYSQLIYLNSVLILAIQKQFTAYLFQQIASYFPSNLHEPYGFYLKNHALDMTEIEEQLYLNKIRTEEDFKPWLENAKRSLIQANKLYRKSNGIVLTKKISELL